jgi:alpha-ketoglutarate-dependent taurine dioxygenase
MTGRAPVANLQVETLTATVGAVVSHVDLNEPQSDAMMRAIEAALHQHAVLFFLDQHLEDERQVAFGRWYGDLDIHHSGRNHPDHPEIYVLEGYSRDIEWHADLTFAERPCRASVLKAVTLPPVGGDTLWTSTCAAYEGLSASMQCFIDGLHAYHDSSRLNNRDPHLDVVHAIHPVVIDHPVTRRRSIFVNSMFTKRIVELSERESAQVLDLLYQHLREPSYQVRWRWQPNCVAMWDNYATQHCVVVDYTEPRKMHRVTITGSRPTSSVFHQAARESSS